MGQAHPSSWAIRPQPQLPAKFYFHRYLLGGGLVPYVWAAGLQLIAYAVGFRSMLWSTTAARKQPQKPRRKDNPKRSFLTHGQFSFAQSPASITIKTENKIVIAPHKYIINSNIVFSFLQ